MTLTMASAQVISDYLRWMRARKLAESTRKTAGSILHGLSHHAQTGLLEITPEQMQEWQMARAEELAIQTLRTQGSYIIGFYRWALKNGHIERDPTVVLELPSLPRRIPRPIAEATLARALDAADDHMRAILSLAAFAGLRAKEIARLEWGDVVLTGPEPSIRVSTRAGKGGHERIIDLTPLLADALSALPGRRGVVIRRLDGKPGRNSANRISQMTCRYLHDVVETDDNLHSLRHRFVTRVYLHQKDLRAAQEAAGHASPTTTAGYTQVARRSIREAIQAAGEIQAS